MSVRSKSLMIAVAAALALGALAEAEPVQAQSQYKTFAGQKRMSKAQQKLFASVRGNDLAGVRASLDAGADVFVTDGMGNRPADIAVDLGLFDIAHYLLSVMDQKRRAAATKTPLVGDALLAASPASATIPQAPQAPQVAPQTPQAVAPQVPLKAPSKPPAPVVSGPNPFDVVAAPAPAPVASPMPPAKVKRSLAEVLNAPSSPSVDLAQPTVKMAATPPTKTSAAQANAQPAPVLDPQSRLHVPPRGAEPQPTPKPEVKAPPTPKPVSKPVVQPEPVPPVELAAKPAPKLYVAPAPQQAPPPKSEPQAEPQAEPKDQAGWFDKMTSFFTSEETKEAQPAPKPQPVAAQVAALPKVQDPPPSQVQPRRAEVKRGVIALTSMVKLGKTPPVKPTTTSSMSVATPEWPCVSKGRWGIVCLEKIDWSQDLAPNFKGMRSNLYRGVKAVVGYENERADFIYAVFPSTNFDAVVRGFSQRLGPPDVISQRGVRPFQKTLEPNPVRTWYGYDAEAGREIVLELSKYDDNRRTFPVMTEGSLKLTYVGEDSIFRYTAPVELQRLN